MDIDVLVKTAAQFASCLDLAVFNTIVTQDDGMRNKEFFWIIDYAS